MKIKIFPKPISFWQMLGPSFIFLGLGLGSGELIVWPYLVANYGLGIIWAAILGITLQFFLNMEIERYSLATGESIFVGFWRLSKFLPVWFIISTFVPWLWPGLIATSAKIVSHVIGGNYQYWTIGMLFTVGLILSLGKDAYKNLERFQKTLILVSVPVILGISLWFLNKSSLLNLGKGILGVGDGYWLLPSGMVLSSFLAGIAYAGAGGNLNLGQSFYIKKKGYGMAKHISSEVSKSKKHKSSIFGYRFIANKINLHNFHKWWRLINLEHGLIFWGLGTLTISLLVLLAFNTAYGHPVSEGLEFLFIQQNLISQHLGSFLSLVFMLVIAATLFATQLTIFDVSSRIISENILLLFVKNKVTQKIEYYSYLIFLWLQILAGIGVIMMGINQPLTLIIISAGLNAVAMFIYSGLVLVLNQKLLLPEISGKLWRKIIVGFGCVFYGTFSLITLLSLIN